MTACAATPIHRIAAPIVTPVPWAALPPAAPTPQAQPTLLPVPVGTRICAAGDLQARFGYPNGAGGLNFRAVVLANQSTSPCQLSGTPQVQLADSMGRPQAVPTAPNLPPATSSRTDLPPLGGPVLLQPNSPLPTGYAMTPGTASVTLTWRRDDLGTCPNPSPIAAVVLSWPGSGGSLRVATESDTAISLSTCTGLGVAPFAGVQPPAPEPAPRAALLSATIELPRVRAGVVEYTVRLYNGDTRPLDLAAEQCPNYSEILIGAGGTPAAKGVYQLNCTGVIIPPGGASGFAMRLPPPTNTAGSYTLQWTLSQAGPGPVVSARATVVLPG